MQNPLPKSLKELFRNFDLAERQMLILHWAEEMTPPDIGELLGIPVTCVQDVLSDIRRRVTRAVGRAGSQGIPA